MPSHFRIHELLKDEPKTLADLQVFVRESPGRTVDEVYEWMLAHGYQLARSSAGNWLREFRLKDRYTASNEIARSFMEAAKSGGTAAVSDAAILQLGQLIFERLADGGEGMEVKELWGLSMALKNVVTGKRHVEKLKTEVADALIEAEKSAKSGGSGEAVVNRVRELLGIKAQSAEVVA